MAQITAASVKALREKTGLPMMECKQALNESGGDEEAAIRYLRERGKQTMAGRADHSTEEGRLAIYTDMQQGVGTMIELLCESAQVANHEEFVTLANSWPPVRVRRHPRNWSASLRPASRANRSRISLRS